jgi:hypothetical protein
MSYSGVPVLCSRHDEGENPNSKDLGLGLGKNGCEKKRTKKEAPKKTEGSWCVGPSEAALAAKQMGLNRNGTEVGGLLSCAFERISGEIPRGPLHDCTTTPWRVTLQAACSGKE